MTKNITINHDKFFNKNYEIIRLSLGLSLLIVIHCLSHSQSANSSSYKRTTQKLKITAEGMKRYPSVQALTLQSKKF